MESDKYQTLAPLDFKKSQELQVSGFPTVFLLVENNYYKIAAGYTTFENLENVLKYYRDVKFKDEGMEHFVTFHRLQ